MYADLAVELKTGVQSNTLKIALADYLTNSAVPANLALAGKPLAGYAGQAVGAANFPSGTVVVYLHIVSDEISIYVYGKSIPQLKDQCTKSLKQLKRISGVKISKASASIMIPINGTDVDILTGQEGSWFRAFWEALKDKATSKLIPAAVVVGLSLAYFVPTSPPVATSIIAIAATAVGVLAEAGYSAWSTESWTWKESK